MATIGVICDDEGQPLRVEYRALPPNNEVLRGVLAVRPGGMVVFEQTQEQPVIAETADDADFRLRTEDEIRSGRQRLDAGLQAAQLGTVRDQELQQVGARKTVAAGPPPGPPPLRGPEEQEPAPPFGGQQQQAEVPPADNPPPAEPPPPGPPQPPQPPAVDDLVRPPAPEADVL